MADFSYAEQKKWPGVCPTNKRQSPINIITENVKVNNDLTPLDLSSAWTVPHEGEFINTGTTARFNPAVGFVPAITTHLGSYDLLQVHFHWGRRTGEGCEHLIDGSGGELEVHFVHRKQGATDPSAGDFLAVIGALADVDEDASLSGPWTKLDAKLIQNYKVTTPVTGFRYDQLLPKNLDYYFYEGSLTTPPCSETVSWFVLKDRITVPGAYLKQLRQLRGSGERLVTYNFRMTQDIAGRTVTTPSCSLGEL